MEALYFILGIILGGILVTAGSIIITARNERNSQLKPLEKFIKSPLKDWNFVQRVNDYFMLSYQQYMIYGDLNKKTIVVFENEKPIIIEIESNKKEMRYIYNRLIKGFNREIFTNVTEVGNYVFSNNVVQNNVNNEENVIDVYDSLPSVDDILDKIQESGMESLSKKEMEILKNFGK